MPGFQKYIKCMTPVTSRVQNSATGMAIHVPVIPKNFGRIRSDRTINPKVLQKEITAEMVPLDRAVKNPEDVMLMPLNRKLMANRRKPAAASS